MCIGLLYVPDAAPLYILCHWIRQDPQTADTFMISIVLLNQQKPREVNAKLLPCVTWLVNFLPGENSVTVWLQSLCILHFSCFVSGA